MINPYREKYYHYIVDNYGDENNEIEEISAYFQVNIEGYKESVVREHFKKLPVSTLEEALAARDNVRKLCVRLGGIPNTVHKEIEELIEEKKYKIIYEKYAGLAKSSLEEWYSCRGKIEKLTKELEVADGGEKILKEIEASILKFKEELAKSYLNTLPRTTEEEAKKKLAEYCGEIELSRDNAAMREIEGIIKQIDINIRTVEGYEFESKEKAGKANDEKEIIDGLLNGRCPVSRGDYKHLLGYLDNNAITPELEQIYRKRYNDGLERISKLSKRAKEYEYRKKSRLGIVGSSKRGVIIYAIIYALGYNRYSSGIIRSGDCNDCCLGNCKKAAGKEGMERVNA
jgi:hypothetical protein